jgi:ABC-type Fe3+/spermidine/putrescine transport system ATPase subunit
MTMSDRIAVMEGGELRQFAPPREVYDRPPTCSSPASSARRR